MTARGDTVLQVRGLTVGYGRAIVLRDVDLEIRRGEFWFLLGPNGTGKTTLLRALLGLLRPSRGEIWRAPGAGDAAHIGFVPQRCDPNPWLPTTVREFVALGTVGLGLDRRQTAQRVAQALARVGLGDHGRRSHGALSGGERQRALLARALVREPVLLVLDEPTGGLDPAGERAFLGVLLALRARERGAVVFVTHDLGIAAEHATHVALFQGGGVYAGPRDAILTPAHLERLYGIRLPRGLAEADSLQSVRLGGHG